MVEAVGGFQLTIVQVRKHGLRVLRRIVFFDCLFKAMLITTINLMEALTPDMGGQMETYLSGRMYGAAVFSLIRMGLPPPPYDLLAGVVWALGLEIVERHSLQNKSWIEVLLFPLSFTVFIYCCLTQYSADCIGDYVRYRDTFSHRSLMEFLTGPILRSLVQGTGPGYVFLYCALWGVPLGVLCLLLWRLVRSRLMPSDLQEDTKASAEG